jgi:hypothetical protein
VLLVDVGPEAVPLHVFSPFMKPIERLDKERAVAAVGTSAWVWSSDCELPTLPAPGIHS